MSSKDTRKDRTAVDSKESTLAYAAQCEKGAEYSANTGRHDLAVLQFGMAMKLYAHAKRTNKAAETCEKAAKECVKIGQHGLAGEMFELAMNWYTRLGMSDKLVEAGKTAALQYTMARRPDKLEALAANAERKAANVRTNRKAAEDFENAAEECAREGLYGDAAKNFEQSAVAYAKAKLPVNSVEAIGHAIQYYQYAGQTDKAEELKVRLFASQA